MNNFVEVFDENDLKDLNLEPIKKREVAKIVRSISNHKVMSKTTRTLTHGKIYIPEDSAKQLVKMMLKT